MPAHGLPEGAPGSDRMRMTLSGQVCGDPSRDVWTVQSTYEFRGSRYIPGRMPQRAMQQPPFRMVCQPGSDKDRELRARYPHYQVGSCEFTAPSIKVYRPMYDQPGIKEHEGYALVTTVNDEGPCQTVKAVARAPGSIGRAEAVTLDASESKGPIRRYVWSFRPGEGCPAGLEPFTLEGPKQSFQVLCPLQGTLTVVGEEEDDRDSQEFALGVTPRKWRTEFSYGKEDSKSFVGPVNLDGQTLGKNRCAEDGAGDYHWIHSDPGTSSWLEHGYKVAQVAEGPFAGFFYVSETSLHITRKTYINPSLLPGGLIYELNKATNLDNMLRLIRQVRAHERFHSSLVQVRLVNEPGFDPAVKLEAMMYREQAMLVDRADIAIRDVNARLSDASDDAEIARLMLTYPDFNRSGRIIVPAAGGGTTDWPIRSFANLYGS
jgi:hypothetical protein